MVKQNMSEEIEKILFKNFGLFADIGYRFRYDDAKQEIESLLQSERESVLGIDKIFWEKAKKNIEKWGVQSLDILGLAIAEETGELCQAILQYEHEQKPIERIEEEIDDLGALLYQVKQKLSEMRRKT